MNILCVTPHARVLRVIMQTMVSKKTQYVVGVDVGLNSTGLAAIEVDDDGAPIRILNAMSVIHDGGVDPAAKEADSRLATAGVARRTRRMRRRRAQRLARLETVLKNYGYTEVEPVLEEPFGPWICRAELADGFIADDEEHREMIGAAVRHIARHRGWRNPYQKVQALLNVGEDGLSEEYANLKNRIFDEVYSHKADYENIDQVPDYTPAQLIRDYLDSNLGRPAARIRTGKAGPRKKRYDAEGILPQRMRQADYAYELNRIFSMQKVDEDEARAISKAVFEAKSPRGSAEKRVGKDPLTGKMRALKASLAFQRYRILATITNLMIQDKEKGKRRLSITEKNDVYNYLISIQSDEESPTWQDIANDVLHIERYQLVGVGKTFDGGERVSNVPPVLQSVVAIHELSDKKLREKLDAWWDAADDGSHECMIELLSNAVDIDRIDENDERYASALDFFDGLDDEELTKLDGINLPSGRAAYSAEALTKLTSAMLNTDDNLFEARQRIYHVGNDWRPPQPQIGEPLGNPAVDRVLKIVNRYLMSCLKRWGQPSRVTIEHVRSGFTSVKQAREYQKETDRRAKYRGEIIQELKHCGLGDVREYDIRRWEAVQRQECQCLYCGREITFKTCEMDHIVPRKGPGSTNTRTNFAAVCPECNRLKSNMPFATWAKTGAAQARGVSLDEAIKRVKFFSFTQDRLPGKAQHNFRNAVISRLKQTVADEPLDNRSIESVSWMADELHRRIDWYFNHDRYEKKAEEAPADGLPETRVAVYPGSVTASARHAAGLGGNIHFIGARYKTRLDRRHHAVDACMIAIMRSGIAKLLAEREQLRQSQRLMEQIEPDEMNWKDYPNENTPGFENFAIWREQAHALLDEMNDALNNDWIPVTRWQRLQLGNGSAHKDTIHPLKKVELCGEISASDILHAASPALYEALITLPDYDPASGLPENPDREINVNGKIDSGSDLIPIFESNAAQIAIQNGSAELGEAFHHARIYRCWTVQKNGKKKIFYGMVRVYQHDLLKAKHEDLFTYPLKRSTVSMRYAEPKVVDAIYAGNAEYLGSICVGDELVVNLAGTEQTGQVGDFCKAFAEDASVNPAVVNRWTVDGFPDPAKLRLRPSMLAGEGLKNTPDLSEDYSDSLGKILNDNGWRPAVNVLAKLGVKVIRRNALGEPRWKSHAHLPISFRWSDGISK